MSEQDKQDAATHAKRAATQGRQAAKNTVRAVEDVAHVAADQAEEIVEGVERVSGEVVGASKKRFTRLVAAMTGDTAMGFLALTVSVYTGAIAFNKFNSAYKRKLVIDSRAFAAGRKVG